MKIRLPEWYPDTIMTGKSTRGRTLWRVQHHFHYFIDDVRYRVPIDYITDHASVPRAFWWLCPPADPKYAAASLIHDYCYSAELWTRKKNDLIFLAIMQYSGVRRWRRAIMYAAVRVGGGITYQDHTKKSIKHDRALNKITSMKRPLYR
jgi:hypothetical protein